MFTCDNLVDRYDNSPPPQTRQRPRRRTRDAEANVQGTASGEIVEAIEGLSRRMDNLEAVLIGTRDEATAGSETQLLGSRAAEGPAYKPSAVSTIGANNLSHTQQVHQPGEVWNGSGSNRERSGGPTTDLATFHRELTRNTNDRIARLNEANKKLRTE
jgi:hypothetical protein